MQRSIPCDLCSGPMTAHFELLGEHLHAVTPARHPGDPQSGKAGAEPAPAQRHPGASQSGTTGHGGRDYWRARDRETKELATRDASLFGLSPSRVSHVLGVYGKRKDWERTLREEEWTHEE
jgi:hypothetical protein